MIRILIALALTWLFSPTLLSAQTKPDLLLAEKYQMGIDLSQYWLSEKYDGVRAFWDGKQLISRQGNPFHAPKWFTKGLPNQPLDGELWRGRGEFAATLSTVSKHEPVDSQWQKIYYMIFELPDAKGNFTQRIEQINTLVQTANLPFLQAVPQFRIKNKPKLLQAKLDNVIKLGGEGLMLHRADAVYHGGRSNDLLKVKRHQDAEATVIKHLAGKGKYTGLLGAIVVETKQGLRFRIGTGFSDAERANPPAIGSIITYKYFGKTKNGVPRFASYLRPWNSN